MCLETKTALGLQYVQVREPDRFLGELASVVIGFRDRNRELTHGQLSWAFVNELMSALRRRATSGFYISFNLRNVYLVTASCTILRMPQQV